MKRDGNGFGIVLLLISVATVILVCVLFAKKDVDDYKEVQQTISGSEIQAEEYKEAVDAIDSQIEQDYDAIDNALE